MEIHTRSGEDFPGHRKVLDNGPGTLSANSGRCWSILGRNRTNSANFGRFRPRAGDVDRLWKMSANCRRESGLIWGGFDRQRATSAELKAKLAKFDRCIFQICLDLALATCSPEIVRIRPNLAGLPP